MHLKIHIEETEGMWRQFNAMFKYLIMPNDLLQAWISFLGEHYIIKLQKNPVGDFDFCRQKLAMAQSHKVFYTENKTFVLLLEMNTRTIDISRMLQTFSQQHKGNIVYLAGYDYDFVESYPEIFVFENGKIIRHKNYSYEAMPKKYKFSPKEFQTEIGLALEFELKSPTVSTILDYFDFTEELLAKNDWKCYTTNYQ